MYIRETSFFFELKQENQVDDYWWRRMGVTVPYETAYHLRFQTVLSS